MPERHELSAADTREGQEFYLNLPKTAIGLHNTSLGESIYHIARQQTGSDNPKVIENYAHRLIKLNADVLRSKGIPPEKANIFRPMPYSTLLLPKKGGRIELDDINATTAKQHAKMVNHLPYAQREILHQIINHPEIDIATYNSVAIVTKFMQHLAHTLREKREDINDIVIDMGLAISERYNDALKEMAKALKHSLAETEEALGKYLSAADIDKKVAREAFLEAHHELNKHFNKAVRHLNALQLKVSNAGYYRNAKNLVDLRKAGKVVKLFDLDAFQAASRVFKITEAGGFLLFFAELGKSAHDTYESYKHHEDWEAKLAEGLTLTGVGGLAGEAIGSMIIIPELGPIALIVGAVIAGALAYGLGKAMTTVVEHFFETYPK